MTITVIDKGDVADEALPLEDFAAQMRLADGVTTDDAQTTRLRSRLRAAIDAVERRLGVIVLSRTMTLAGGADDARRVRLPIRPTARVLSARVKRNGSDVDLGPVAIEDEAGVVLVLTEPVRTSERLQIVIEAGHARWADVPASLRQAVLLMAEALDAGEGDVLTPMVAALLSSFRDVRLGRRS